MAAVAIELWPNITRQQRHRGYVYMFLVCGHILWFWRWLPVNYIVCPTCTMLEQAGLEMEPNPCEN